MRKFLKQILFFTLLVFIGYPTILFSLHIAGKKVPNLNPRSLVKDHLNLRLNDADSTKNADLLFLGSSHAYRGFDNRIFKDKGYSSFNLGSSSQTPKQTQILLEKYIDQLNPRLVVFEVSPLYLSKAGQESTLDFVRGGNSFGIRASNAWNGLNMLVFNSWLVKEISEITGIGSTEPVVAPIDKYVKGGYVERELRYSNLSKLKAKKKEGKLLSDQMEVLNEMFAMLNEKEIKYLCIEAPVTRKYYKQYEPKRDEFNEFMKEHSYTNFNLKMNLNDSLNFYDSHHMNKTGVVQFNNLVLNKIRHELE